MSQQFSIVDEFTELNAGPFKIATFGRVYRSNGATFGPTGSIGGLSRDNVLNHCRVADEKRMSISWRLFAADSAESVFVSFGN